MWKEILERDVVVSEGYCWKFALEMSGVQFVVIPGIELMPKWLADS